MSGAAVRIYRTSIRWRMGAAIFGAVMVAGGLFVFVAVAIPLPGFDFAIRSPRWASYLFFGVICLAAVLMGAACTAGVWMYKVVLGLDSIEVSGAFRRRSLEKGDILAKAITFVGVRTYVLYPRDKRQRPLQVGVMFPENHQFRDWIAEIPDRFPAPKR